MRCSRICFLDSRRGEVKDDPGGHPRWPHSLPFSDHPVGGVAAIAHPDYDQMDDPRGLQFGSTDVIERAQTASSTMLSPARSYLSFKSPGKGVTMHYEYYQ